ncbi:MAG: YggS family pyridoxal phosphate-dependent enzyme [Paludibacter sp.]|nr:YggS family pyridoxal phosphate-dependent enzyme [Paludibacter sp.]MDD4197869.1 YggS family pyridoxal phosphate-dependent enzyme [Paludibacter sp.]MDD4428141.1 YggS family pyridoxal phosphate-dependent enzyme [Paludibacter sp.]
MSIAQNLSLIREHIPAQVKLVCVSKFHPDNAIMEAYQSGERIFGESRVQELTEKQERLPKDIHWHFIGHLQTNKVKYLVPFVELIHGVDSLKLLTEINKQAEKINQVVNCLLQVHIATEETKFGFSAEELLGLYQSDKLSELPFIRVCGLMGMATFTENHQQVRKEFQTLKSLYDTIKTDYVSGNDDFREISMGMSDDYQLAIEEGSTMIRIGSSIFGQRIY